MSITVNKYLSKAYDILNFEILPVKFLWGSGCNKISVESHCIPFRFNCQI